MKNKSSTVFKKGNIPWNKNKKGYHQQYNGYVYSDERKKKMSENLKVKYASGKLIIWNKGKKGLQKAWNKGNGEYARRLGFGKWMKGTKWSSETREKMNNARKGIPAWNKGKKLPKMSGENHWNWIADRSQLKKTDRRGDSAYIEWRKEIWLRDKFKCKISNLDCKGRLETHHILCWREYPELRYDINNGILLCQFHHPRKRIDEQKLIPIFQELVKG